MAQPGRDVVVFAGAPLAPTPRLRARLRGLRQPRVIAADGGAVTALAFGLRPHLVVGDFDSLPEQVRGDLVRRSVPLEPFPRDKDATDGALALERALSFEPRDIVLLGYLNGPRLDMTLASAPLLETVRTRAYLLDERNECLLLRGPEHYAWLAESDELISLVPLAGDCLGVRTSGLRWPLRDERLVFGGTRGMSNEPIAERVSVAISDGRLLLSRHFARV
ncbi:MAG: thiamine diphosphokinase [Chloroflexota bacterium]|nr:thiamine diphosphokinase [Chloroflexota bacterium]